MCIDRSSDFHVLHVNKLVKHSDTQLWTFVKHLQRGRGDINIDWVGTWDVICTKFIYLCIVFLIVIMSREREEIVNEYSQLRVKVERLSIKLRRYCLEQDVSSIQSGLVEIKQLFETTEDLYYMLVDTSETVADTESFDKKYSESTKLYCDVVKACKKTLKECGVQTTMGEGIVNAENVDISSSQTSIASELANAITLPKINVPIFSGESSEYATFVNLFDEAIANKISCNRSKLTHLSALLRGEALQAVKPFLTEN